MKCPKCSAPMETVTHAGIEVDRCTGCHGIWFDMLEAEKLREASGSEAIDIGDPPGGRRSSENTQIECPRCHTRMLRMTDPRQSHIAFESCSVCYGLFLDAGEFRDLKEETFTEMIGHYRSMFRK